MGSVYTGFRKNIGEALCVPDGTLPHCAVNADIQRLSVVALCNAAESRDHGYIVDLDAYLFSRSSLTLAKFILAAVKDTSVAVMDGR